MSQEYCVILPQNQKSDMYRTLLTIGFCCIALMTKAINGKLYSSELLASSSVMDVCQDDHGFIWIATDYGLSRFDGYHFTNYYHVQRDSTTLPDNFVNCFLPDGKGNLWVGHPVLIAETAINTGGLSPCAIPRGSRG